MTRYENLANFFDGSTLDDLSIYCPIPLVMHPAGASALDSAGLRFSLEHGLCSPGSLATRMQVGLMIAAGVPFVTEDAAAAMTCYTYWAFLWQDHADAVSADLGYLVAQVAEANRIMHEPYAVPAPTDKWLTSLRQIRRMLEDSLGHEGLAAVRAENSVWLSAELWSRRLQHRDTPPTLGEYLRMRWPQTGSPPLAAFAAPAAGYTLSAGELYDPVVRAFTHTVFYPAMFINDLVSMAKEIPLGQREVNVYSAMCREHRCDPAEALERTWQLSERITCLMLRLRDQLMADPRPGVARYAAELPQWLPAVAHFTVNSARYLHVPATSEADAVHITPPVLTLTDTPTRWDPDDLTPPPYPDIAWWWSQLAT